MVKFAVLSYHGTSGRSCLKCTVLLGKAWSFLHAPQLGDGCLVPKHPLQCAGTINEAHHGY